MHTDKQEKNQSMGVAQVDYQDAEDVISIKGMTFSQLPAAVFCCPV